MPQFTESATDSQAERLLTFYARAAAHPAFDTQLDTWLTNLGATLGHVAIQVATQVERPQPLITALHQIIRGPTISLTQLEQLAAATPRTSHALADWLAELAMRLVAERRTAAQTQPETAFPGLATSLNNLSVRLADLGRWEEGLAAISEAVEVYRGLAEERPDAFLPNLAMSLNNLSVDLGDLGRREEALAAISEAVEIRRGLARVRPDAFLPDLAASLNNLSVRLGALGRREEGLAAISEAVEIRRGLAEARPDAFLPDLATSLNNLSVDLGNLGRREEGVAAVSEAVEIRRKLAEKRPAVYQDSLAKSLNVLAWLEALPEAGV